jgi:hypothetical protein
MQVVNINDCSWDTSAWNVTGLSPDDYNFEVAGIRANWGYQGDYTKDDPTGFWPEVYSAIEASIDANFTRQLYSDSNGVMEAINEGEADITESYWTFGATWVDNKPVVELFDWSCIVLGTDSVFFVKKCTTTSAPSEGYSTWVVILTSTLAGLAFCGCLAIACFSYHIIQKQKKGNPVYMAMGDKDNGSKVM